MPHFPPTVHTKGRGYKKCRGINFNDSRNAIVLWLLSQSGKSCWEKVHNTKLARLTRCEGVAQSEGAWPHPWRSATAESIFTPFDSAKVVSVRHVPSASISLLLSLTKFAFFSVSNSLICFILLKVVGNFRVQILCYFPNQEHHFEVLARNESFGKHNMKRNLKFAQAA